MHAHFRRQPCSWVTTRDSHGHGHVVLNGKLYLPIPPPTRPCPVLYHVERVMVHGCEGNSPVHLTVRPASPAVLVVGGVLGELLALAVWSVFGEDEARHIHEEFEHLGQRDDADPDPEACKYGGRD